MGGCGLVLVFRVDSRLDMDPGGGGGGGASYLGVCHPRVTRSLLKRVKSS